MAGNRPARVSALNLNEGAYGRRQPESARLDEQAMTLGSAADDNARSATGYRAPASAGARAQPAPAPRGPTVGIGPRQPPSQPPANSLFQSPWIRGRLDPNQIAKGVVGKVARDAGVIAGVPRGMWHAGRDAVDTAYFIHRLTNAYDPRDQAAAFGEAANGARSLFGATRWVYNNPTEAAKRGLAYLNTSLNPEATPQGTTIADEMRRNWEIGKNRGELAFNVATLVYGPGELRMLAGLGRAAKVATEAEKAAKYAADVARFQKEGIPLNLARYFAETYKGIGHHYWPTNAKYKIIGNRKLPTQITDLPILRLKPEGINNGDFYKLHFQVDPSSKGGRISAEHGGGGWNGKKLGWQRYDRAGRMWYGAPRRVKTIALGAAGTAAGGIFGQTDDAE